MRTIYREIVGGFIFSKDGKILLGKSCKGGVYENSFLVPGGGIDEGETKEAALHREMLEETGIDISNASIKFIRQSSGEHQKTSKDTGERVFMKMNFHNYRIDLDQNADDVDVVAEDDWCSPHWFKDSELIGVDLSGPTRDTLTVIGIIPS